MAKLSGGRKGIVGAGLLATACLWAGSNSAWAEPQLPLPLGAVDDAGLAVVDRLPLSLPANEAAWAVPAAAHKPMVRSVLLSIVGSPMLINTYYGYNYINLRAVGGAFWGRLTAIENQSRT